MKNIVLLGLIYDSNLGDEAIYLSTRHMLGGILSEADAGDVELRGGDITGKEGIGRKPDTLFMRAGYSVLKLKRKLLKICCGIDKAQTVYKRDMRRLGAKYICRKTIDAETVGIIFAGGGMIKFSSTQDLSPCIDAVTEYADRRGIPVMFSSVGVEGYDEKSKGCRLIKNALNRACVKMITTRDDIELLRDSYITRAEIITGLAADPACLLNELYPFDKKRGDRHIGLGCARGDLFTDYGIDFKAEDAEKLWIGLYRILTKNGYKCSFFSNGLKSDHEFAQRLVNKMDLQNEPDIIKPRPSSTKELADQITGFDAVIACRLHAGIIAYSYDIPCIEPVWNNKQKMFGQITGHPERFIETDKLDPDFIAEALKKALSESSDGSRKDEYRQTTKKYLRAFTDMIRKSGRLG